MITIKIDKKTLETICHCLLDCSVALDKKANEEPVWAEIFSKEAQKLRNLRKRIYKNVSNKKHKNK